MSIESKDPQAAHEDHGGHDGAAWVDVRTVQEFEAGHPEGAVNVPWAVIDPGSGQMAHNADFLPTMQKHFAAEQRLYLSCQAGMRSMNACKELDTAGYSNLVNVDGGFGGRRDPMGALVTPGWQECGLPVANSGSDYETLKA
jgi:rhodanese-related sulfurtransferase